MSYIFPVLGGGRITSDFGPRETFRTNNGAFASRNHGGIDIAATAGTPVVAPISGQVISVGVAGGYGNQVKILGSDGITHSFNHLQGYSVRPGMNVSAGQQLGLVGSTGNATGAHLHYETSSGKLKIDPKNVLNSALDAGIKTAKNAVGKVLSGIAKNPASILVPGGPQVGALLGGLGIGGAPSCDLICQLKKWVTESHFFQRLALAIFAFIILLAAFYMMKSNAVSSIIERAKG